MSRAAESEQVASWLKARAIPLRSLVPGHGTADLAPLAEVLAGVRVVGLGEATHGSREFFTLKHRLVEHLVTELGFTVFAMEASWSAAHVVDDYVRRGIGDASAALGALGYWTWDTEEVLALVEWLRSYNAGVPPERQVRFRGVDPVLDRAAVVAVAEYLDEAAPGQAAALRGAIPDLRQDIHKLSVGVVLGEVFRGIRRKLRGAKDPGLAKVRAAREAVAGVLTWLRDNPVDSDAWRRAVGHAWVLDRAAEIRTHATLGRAGANLRDRVMAEAVRRILTEEAEGARVALWAHNGHLAAATPSAKETSLGAELRAVLGEQYYALCLTANEGDFQAMKMGTTELEVYSLDPAEPGTLEAQLTSAVPDGDYLVDLRGPAGDPVVEEWLGARNRMRGYGSVVGFWPALRKESTEVTLREEFDGIAHIARMTRARGIRRA